MNNGKGPYSTKCCGRGKDKKTGRFLPANRYSRGRPLGSKVKLSENFYSDLAKDYNKYGAKTIAHVRQSSPETYLKILAGLMPKEMVAAVEINAAMEITNRTEQILNAYRLLGEPDVAEIMEVEEATEIID